MKVQVAISTPHKWEVGLLGLLLSLRERPIFKLLQSLAWQSWTGNQRKYHQKCLFLRVLRLWLKIKRGERFLTFSSDLCVWHFPELLSVATSKCDINVSFLEAALRYILLSLQDGKGIFPKSPFWFVIHTHPHNPLHHTGPHLTMLQLLFLFCVELCAIPPADYLFSVYLFY